jgi:hypothetical protein
MANCISFRVLGAHKHNTDDIPQVETKCRPRKDFDSMTHHGHFMKSRLAIEDNQVSVSYMTLNLNHNCHL